MKDGPSVNKSQGAGAGQTQPKGPVRRGEGTHTRRGAEPSKQECSPAGLGSA